MPESLQTIGGSAFYGCTGLTELNLSESLQTIGGSAFYGCMALGEIVIPDGVTYIGDGAFARCTSLGKIEILTRKADIQSFVFSETPYVSDPGNWKNGMLVIDGYLIDVAEDLIAHIFDINNSEYCFNLLKEAKAAFDVLTATERAQVANAGVLDAKLSELTAAMGKTPDFSLTYAENMPQTPDDPTEPPTGGDDEPGTGDDEPKAFPVGVIIVIAVVVVVGGAVVAVVVLKKKKN